MPPETAAIAETCQAVFPKALSLYHPLKIFITSKDPENVGMGVFGGDGPWITVAYILGLVSLCVWIALLCFQKLYLIGFFGFLYSKLYWWLADEAHHHDHPYGYEDEVYSYAPREEVDRVLSLPEEEELPEDPHAELPEFDHVEVWSEEVDHYVHEFEQMDQEGMFGPGPGPAPGSAKQRRRARKQWESAVGWRSYADAWDCWAILFEAGVWDGIDELRFERWLHEDEEGNPLRLEVMDDPEGEGEAEEEAVGEAGEGQHWRGRLHLDREQAPGYDISRCELMWWDIDSRWAR